MTKTLALAASVLFAAVATVPVASAQSQRPIVITEEHHDVSPALRDMPAVHRTTNYEVDELLLIPRPHAVNLPDGAVQKHFNRPSPNAQPTLGASFIGLGVGFPGFSLTGEPSDNNITVGPNAIIDIVNTEFAILSKTGATILSPRAINSLWAGFGGACQADNNGDPVALYDKVANRWLIGQFALTTPYQYCVAVSQTSDPTGAYNRYAFSFGNVNFPDYPKVGVWPDAYYATFNIFANGQNFSGAQACAFDRTSMIAGLPATGQCFMTSNQFGGLLPSDVDGVTQPPAGSPNYVVALGATNTQLAFWKFHVDFTTPANSTFTGPTAINIASFSNLGSVPQKNVSQRLDSLSDRLMYRLSYRNFGDHESLFVNHSVVAGTGGGVRWYELRNPATTPTVFQQGTFAPDNNFRWMGAIGSDQNGDLAIGYSVSSATQFPSISYTGRVPSDPPGTMQPENSILAGTGSQNGHSRWGDYSSVSVDPTDDCTFWYTQEYLATTGDFTWSTHIASFKFPTCGNQTPDFSFGASPSTITVVQGTSGNTTATATSINNYTGSLNLSVTGLPSGATFSAVPNPITVPSGGSATSTVTISTTNTTAPGTYPLTLTATDGTLTHNTSVSLVVTANGGGGTVTVTPSSLSFGNGYIGNPGTTLAVTIKNTGSTTVTVNSVTVTANYTETNTCTTLAPAASCKINVTFAPTTTGTLTGTLTINDTATGSPQTVSLTGNGNHSLGVSPTSLSFGTVNVGSTSTAKTVTVTNSQHVDVPTTGITVTGDYAISGGTCPTGPGTVTARTSCTVLVTFTPTTSGVRTGTLSIGDNAPDSPFNVSLTGTGSGTQNADFSFGAAPTTITVVQGSAGSTTATATSINHFAGNVTVSIAGLPSGATATFTPNPIVVADGGSGNSVVNISTTVSTAPGTYPLTITGTSGSLVHTASVSLVVTGNGGSGTVTITPTSLAFGNGFIGATSAPLIVTIKNTGSTSVTVNSLSVTANFAQTNNCTTLAAGASCRANVTFSPTTLGAISGTLTINDTANGSPQTVSLTGNGNSSLGVSPTSLNFGTVNVGTTSTAKTITVTNNQHVDVATNGITATGDYAISGGTCPTGPGTITARTSCTVLVTFTPTTTGTRTGTAAITDNAPDSPLNVSLTGVGH